MIKKISRNEMRLERHKRIRKTLSGTAERPRLSVFRSNANITAQIIDDEKGVTLVSASTLISYNLKSLAPFTLKNRLSSEIAWTSKIYVFSYIGVQILLINLSLVSIM